MTREKVKSSIVSNALEVCACMEGEKILYVLCVYRDKLFQFHRNEMPMIQKASSSDYEYMATYHKDIKLK